MKEVAVAQRLRRRPDLRWRGWVDAGDQVAESGGRRHHVRAVARQRAFAVACGHLPLAVPAGQAHDFPVHDDAPALRFDLPSGALPHHAGSLSRIAEGVDEGLDRLLRLHVSREERVFQRGPQGQPPDPLRRPVRRDLLAGHPPDLLGVGLEEDVEQAPAEPVADPLCEVRRMPVRQRHRFQVRQDAERRLQHAELAQRVARLQGVVEAFAPVVDPGLARPFDEPFVEDLLPEAVHLRGFREEAVSADVAEVSLASDGAGDSPRLPVSRSSIVTGYTFTCEQVCRRQSGRSPADAQRAGLRPGLLPRRLFPSRLFGHSHVFPLRGVCLWGFPLSFSAPDRRTIGVAGGADRRAASP